MAQITLVYLLNVGIQNSASPTLLARAADIDFNQGTLDMLGMDIVGNETVAEPPSIKRTIVLQTNSLGDSLWRSIDALKYATRNLFQDVFALRMPAFVTAEEPIVQGPFDFLAGPTM